MTNETRIEADHFSLPNLVKHGDLFTYYCKSQMQSNDLLNMKEIGTECTSLMSDASYQGKLTAEEIINKLSGEVKNNGDERRKKLTYYIKKCRLVTFGLSTLIGIGIGKLFVK